jgi:hypothetical protein
VSDALAFAMLLIHQHLAHDAGHHRKLEQLYLSFLAGRITAEQYERDLGCSTNS